MDGRGRRRRAMISAVMFGAVAGSAVLPLIVEVRAGDPARRQGGGGESARLCAGLEVACGSAGQAAARPQACRASDLRPGRTRAAAFRQPARTMAVEGVRRLVAYQDAATRSLSSTGSSSIADGSTCAAMRADALLAETARHLACAHGVRRRGPRCRAEDLDPSATAVSESEVGAKGDELVAVHDYFKPRVAEIAGALPPRGPGA